MHVYLKTQKNYNDLKICNKLKHAGKKGHLRSCDSKDMKATDDDFSSMILWLLSETNNNGFRYYSLLSGSTCPSQPYIIKQTNNPLKLIHVKLERA